MSTDTHRRIGRRNKFHTPCAACGKQTPPDGGELLAKAEGERWQCLCDACLGLQDSDRAARTEYYRSKFEEAGGRERMRREEFTGPPWDDAVADLINRLFPGRTTRGAAQGYAPPPCLAVLGLDLPTDADQVKRAYRELSKQAHPDAGGSASEFIKLKNAYDSALRLVGAA